MNHALHPMIGPLRVSSLRRSGEHMTIVTSHDVLRPDSNGSRWRPKPDTADVVISDRRRRSAVRRGHMHVLIGAWDPNVSGWL
jgi:hypothetical protein